MSNENPIYKLRLHEELLVKKDDSYTMFATRVPGGWIYESFCPGVGVSSVFVPFCGHPTAFEDLED